MNRYANETIRPDAPVAVEPRPSDDLTPHLVRIVRRALRRTEDNSPLARAVRAAAAQVDTDPNIRTVYAEEIRIRQIARRISALMTPSFRDPPGRGARLETVCA